MREERGKPTPAAGRITKNTGVMFLTRVLEPLFSFVLILGIARYLSSEGLGEYSLVLSLFSIFMVASSLGLGQVITREVARDREIAAAYLSSALIIGLCSSVLMAGLMGTVATVLGYEGNVLVALYIMSFVLVAATLSSYGHALFVAFERLEYRAFVLLVEYTMRIGLSLLVLGTGHGLLGLIGAMVVTRWVALILCIALIHLRITPIRWRVRSDLCRQLLGYAPTFALIHVLSVLYWRTDVIMLSKMRTVAEVGLYTSAYRLMEIWKALPLSLKASLFPLLSRLHGSNPEISERAIKVLFLLLFPVAVGTAILSDRIIHLLYGPGFQGAGYALSVLIWTLVPYGGAMMWANVVVASNHQRADLAINVISFAANIGMNALLIPRFGYLGASTATLLSMGLFASCQYAFVSRRLFRLHLLRPIGRPAVAAACMGLVVWALKDLPLYGVIPLSASVYISLLIGLRVFTPEEWSYMSRWWRRLRRKKVQTKEEDLLCLSPTYRKAAEGGL